MLTRSAIPYGIRLELNGSFLFRLRKICKVYSRNKELDLWEPMVTSYPVEGEKPKMYTISSFLIFSRAKIAATLIEMTTVM